MASSLLLLWFGGMIAGAAMLLRGWFGPRLDDHPHCSRCHYDLTGLHSGRCPECGASLQSLDSVIRSRRVRNWRKMALGVAIALLPGIAWTAWERLEAERRQRPGIFMRAVQMDDVTTVKRMLAEGVTYEGFSPQPLEWAMGTGAQQTFAVLLAEYPQGELPQGTGSESKPLLHLASEAAPWAIAPILAHGVPVDVRDNAGNTTLIATMNQWGGYKAVVADLLEAGADVNARNDAGETPLHYAYMCDGTDAMAVELLIKAGADVNARDKSGRTPLHHHFLRGRGFVGEGIIALCVAGADLCARDNEGRTFGEIATARGHGETARDLWRRQVEPLVKAGDLEAVARLLERDPNAVTYGAGCSQGTLLNWAAGFNEEALARLLLEHGADPNAVDDHGQTALWRAKESMVRLLLERGADPSIPDKSGRTVLHAALSHGNEEQAAMFTRQLAHAPLLTRALAVGQHPNADRMQRLLAAGAQYDIFAAIVLGETDSVRRMIRENPALLSDGYQGVPLLIPAIRAKHDGLVRMLLEMGADPNRGIIDRSISGYVSTPLRDAMDYNRKAVVRMLLDHGADPNATSLFGQSGLHWVRDAEMTQWLLEEGADVNARDGQARTPLHLAAERLADAEVIRVLLHHGADLQARDKSNRTPAQLAGAASTEVRALLSGPTTRPVDER